MLPRKNALPKFPVPADRGKEQGQEIKIDALRMFSQEDAGNHIEAIAIPFSSGYLMSLAVFVPMTVITCWLALGEFGFRTLGDRHFGKWIFLGVCLCIAIILSENFQLLRAWSRLRQLLIFLDRLRLRRTLADLKGLSWESVWKMSGNVLEERYRLISRQLESMRNLQNTLRAWNPYTTDEYQARILTLDCLQNCERARACFVAWYVNLCDPKPPSVADLTPIAELQEKLATAAGCVMKHLIWPAWNKETQSLIRNPGSSGEADQDENDKRQHAPHSADRAKIQSHVSAAEEFFVLPYLGFIQNTIGRLRSIALSIAALFVATTLAISSYPFDPLPVIGSVFLIVFALVGTTVVIVYAEMHRDATLSHLTNTRPGELGLDFWVRVFTFGIGPLIGLLTTLFPSITDFVVSWLQPGAQAIR